MNEDYILNTNNENELIWESKTYIKNIASPLTQQYVFLVEV